MTDPKQPEPDAAVQYVTVGNVDDWAEGQARAVEVGDRIIAVFRHEGQFFAIDDMCPHMGASLASGHFDPETMAVACPWHGWRFDVRDGTWCDNRRIKTDAFPVRVVDGDVQVGVPLDAKPQWKSISTLPGSADAPSTNASDETGVSPESETTGDRPSSPDATDHQNNTRDQNATENSQGGESSLGEKNSLGGESSLGEENSNPTGSLKPHTES